MTIFKTCTSIEQSKKLAEILPIESADMYYWCADHYPKEDWIIEVGKPDDNYECIYAWSLAALLDVLKSEIDGKEGETYQLNIEKDGTWWNVWYKEQHNNADPIEIASTEELIDACYEMIIRLNALKML